MGQAFNKMRSEPEIVGAHLAVVLAFAKRSVGKGLAVCIYKFVFTQLVVQFFFTDDLPWMFQPGWFVGDGFDFVGGFYYPTFAPGVDQSIFFGFGSDQGMGDFEDDRIAILAGATITPVVNKSVTAVGVFLELVAGPFPGARRQVQLWGGSISLGKSPG